MKTYFKVTTLVSTSERRIFKSFGWSLGQLFNSAGSGSETIIPDPAELKKLDQGPTKNLKDSSFTGT